MIRLDCIQYVKCPRGGFVQAWFCEDKCDGAWLDIPGQFFVECPHAKERARSADYPEKLYPKKLHKEARS